MPEAKQILIIESDAQLAAQIQDSLKSAGFDVRTIDIQADFLSVVEQNKPDMVIVDSYQALRVLKEGGKFVPSIFLSDSGVKYDLEEEKQLGIVQHFYKDFVEPKDLVNFIKSYFGLSEEKKEKISNFTIKPRKKFFGKVLDIKIMVAEDYETLREVLTKKLVKEGYIVYPAENGAQVLAAIEDIEPNILLLDIIMPGVDGFEVLRKIRTNPNPKISRIPIVMLTNLGDEQDIQRAMSLGADDYILKANFTIDEIISKIKRFIE